jgi:hypothetical protein
VGGSLWHLCSHQTFQYSFSVSVTVSSSMPGGIVPGAPQPACAVAGIYILVCAVYVCGDFNFFTLGWCEELPCLFSALIPPPPSSHLSPTSISSSLPHTPVSPHRSTVTAPPCSILHTPPGRPHLLFALCIAAIAAAAALVCATLCCIASCSCTHAAFEQCSAVDQGHLWTGLLMHVRPYKSTVSDMVLPCFSSPRAEPLVQSTLCRVHAMRCDTTFGRAPSSCRPILQPAADS